ncbi:MAG: class IV adenylate cyclase [Acidobacteria bacterium]|nr:class IV adenylate cyclase [Acidobacteriota bacterium]
MALEIEKKYRLNETEVERISAALEEFGAEYIGLDNEENIIYGGSELARRGAVLRIRQIKDKVLLTFKRSAGDTGGIKQQIEEETEVADAEAMKAIIAELGFSPVLVYEKKRRTWKFRSVEVVLDELPFGLYMEIEGAITAIKEAEILLDADMLETEPMTYPRLTAKYGVRVGDLIEARFDENLTEEK